MIASDGYKTILIFAGLTAVALLINPVLFVAFCGLTLFTLYFFRNPSRKIPEGDNQAVSPADGKVVFAGPVGNNPYGLKDRLRVSVFMSPLDVHINRVPLSGIVTDVRYQPGKYFAAFSDKASFDNEQMAHFLQTPGGDEIVFVQIAGWLARRIVSRIQKGDQWGRGDAFGMIKFGSRMDVYLPPHYVLKAAVGDRIKGGETVIAVTNGI